MKARSVLKMCLVMLCMWSVPVEALAQVTRLDLEIVESPALIGAKMKEVLG